MRFPVAVVGTGLGHLLLEHPPKVVERFPVVVQPEVVSAYRICPWDTLSVVASMGTFRPCPDIPVMVFWALSVA